MKFFTRTWWENGCENAEHVFDLYIQNFKKIRPLLPPQLVELEQQHTLHDSEVKRITTDFAEKTVVIELLGWDREFKYPVRYFLQFLGVAIFHQVMPQQEYVELELGDLGYWELDQLNGLNEIRMLFVSGAEFTLTFSDFSFSLVIEKAL